MIIIPYNDPRYNDKNDDSLWLICKYLYSFSKLSRAENQYISQSHILTLAGPGRMHPTHEFFLNGRWSAGRITLKFCRAYGLFLAQFLTKIDRIRSGPELCVIIAADRFSTKIVLSAAQIVPIKRKRDVMHDLAQNVTTSDLWHCLHIRRSSYVTNLGWALIVACFAL